MLTHSVDYELAHLATHEVVVVVEVLDANGAVITNLHGTITGSTHTDRRAAIRRTMSLEIVDEDGTLTPSFVGDLLLPFGTEVRISRGVELDRSPEVYSCGIFILTSTEVNESDGGVLIRLEGSDRAVRAQRPLVVPYTVTPGTNYAEAIAGLFIHAWQSGNPAVTVPPVQVAGTTLVAPNLFYDQKADPWAGIQEMATSIGMEAFFNVAGSFVCRPLPAGATPVTWRYVDGMTDTRVNLNRRWDASDTPNYIVVQAAHSSVSPTISATAQDTEADSPTSVNGRYGISPSFVESVLATTEEHCQQEADARLAFSMAGVDAVDLDAVPFSVQEEGDLVQVQRERTELDRYYLVDTIDMPLSAEETMTLGLVRPFNVDPIVPTFTIPTPGLDIIDPNQPGTPELIGTTPGGSAPVADFTVSPPSGNAPLTVQFTDTSTNTPTSWLWDFGD